MSLPGRLCKHFHHDMPETPVRIAIIGAGIIGPRHAQAVEKTPSAELLCFVDPNPATEAVAKSFNVPIYSSIKDMIDASTPDAAVVCTPNHTHVAISRELLAAGIHILLEKPVSTDPAEGLALSEFAKSTSRKLLVGHHRRFNPYVVATKRALEDRVVGKVIAVNGLWMLKKPDTYFQGPASWRASLESGGGVIHINTVHDVDILQHLLGPIVRVFAEGTQRQRGHPAEEGAAIVLRFASGVVGTFLVCDATPSDHSFESGTGENPMIPHSGNDFYRIFGTEGTLSVPDLTLSKNADWTQTLQVEKLDVVEGIPFELQMQHFVRVVRGQEEPSCTAEEGVSAVLVCDALAKALHDGVPVDL